MRGKSGVENRRLIGRKVAPLAADEEKSLAGRIQAGLAIGADSEVVRVGRAAEAELCERNVPLTVKITSDFSRGNADDFDDLIGPAMEGLLVGVRRFDPGRNVRFSTYASYWIRHKIIRERYGLRQPVHVPVYIRDAIAIEAKHGVGSSGVGPEFLLAAGSARRFSYLSDFRFPQVDRSESDRGFSAIEESERSEAAKRAIEAIRSVVQACPELQRTAFLERFDFQTGEVRSLYPEIGRRLGCNRRTIEARVDWVCRRIRKEAEKPGTPLYKAIEAMD